MKNKVMIKKAMLAAIIMILAAGTSLAQKSSGKEEVKIQTNLDCLSCKKKIEDYMTFEKGVTAVNADVKTKVVTIEYRKTRTNKEKLIAAIEKLGYEAKEVENNEDE